jgi:predicted outer membrane repeat protein
LKTEYSDEHILPYLKEHQRRSEKKRALSLLSVGTAACVFAAMMLPGISMGSPVVSLKSDRPTVKPGEAVSVSVSAEAEQETVFLLSPQSGNACLSDKFPFSDGQAEVETESGDTLILHKSEHAGTTEYWFRLDGGKKSEFTLSFNAAASTDSAEDSSAESDAGSSYQTSSASAENSADKQLPADTPAAETPTVEETADSATMEATAGVPAGENTPALEESAESIQGDDKTADASDQAAAAPAEKAVSSENALTKSDAKTSAASDVESTEPEKTQDTSAQGSAASGGTADTETSTVLHAVSGATLKEAETELGNPDAGELLTMSWSQSAETAEVKAVQQTLTAAIYTDDTLTASSNDPTRITVSGELPEGACVKAYPISPEAKGYTVFAAYDITVYRADGSIFEPQSDTMQVSILSPDIPEDGCSVYYVPKTGTPEPMDTAPIDGGVQFEASHFTPYMAASLNLTPTTTADTFAKLQTAIANGGTQVIQLTADMTADSYLTIPSGSNIAIDLNGHCLTDAYTGGPLFSVSGGELIIADSAAGAETTETMTSGNQYGNAAAAVESGGEVTLTYYVTETRVTDSATGATAETLVKHTVTTGGYIKNSSYGNLFSVSDGTLNVQSGMLYGGSDSAVSQTGGTVSLTGGYFCGAYGQNGGAVSMTGGTLSVSGSAVLAGNTASQYGGAVYAGSTNTTIQISGNAVISGNTSTSDGGGIYTVGTISLADSAYLTNNITNSVNLYRGGGGLFLAGNSAQFTMSGGYVTGNYAKTTGGGIGTEEHESDGVTLSATITGGFISGNVANLHEGGGLTVRGYDTCTMTGGSITNNKTLTTRDWGGGGVFISENGTLNIKNVLITDNSSASFGAGVSACSTGKVYLYVQDGAAVYGNTAGSSNPENDAKNEGYEYTHDNSTFLSSGYQDLFCVHQSTITGAMLGGGPANWSGSEANCNSEDPSPSAVIAATKAVSAGKYDVLTADTLMGLTASPTDADKTAAQNAAQVHINGNSSTTHGGGIMSNGSLILGNPVDLTVPAKLTLAATKTFTDSAGTAVSLSNNGFSFVVADSNGKTVSTGTCDTSGAITFTPAISISEETSVFTVTEVNTGRADVGYDASVYTMTVTSAKDSGTYNSDTDKTTYKMTIKNITITKSTDTSFSKSVSPNSADYTLSASSDGITFANTSKPTTSELKTSVTVTKTWSDGNDKHNGDSVTVHLYSGSTDSGMSGVLNAANDWKFTFSGLPYYGSDGTTPITYSVKEDTVTGYTTSYTTTSTTAPTVTVSSSSTVTNFTAGGYYSISADGYAMAVSYSNGAYSLVSAEYDASDTAQLWKAVAGGPPEGYTTVTDGWFYLENVKYPGEWLHFYYKSNTDVSGEVFNLTSTKQTTFHINATTGVLYTEHKYYNAYYTKDVSIGSNKIDLKIEELGQRGTSNTYKSATITDGSAAITVTNAVNSYTLPATGGMGIGWFLAGGLVFMIGSLFLAVTSEPERKRKRRP